MTTQPGTISLSPEEIEEVKRLISEAETNPTVSHNTNSVRSLKKGEGVKFMDRMNLWYLKPKSSFIVTIFYENKTIGHKVVQGNAPYFMDDKKGYVLYKPAGWFDLNHNQTHLLYAEGFVMPIDAISCRGDLAKLSIRPEDVADVIDGEEIKIVLTAQALTKWIKIAIFISAIILIIVFILAAVQVVPLIAKLIAAAQQHAGPPGGA